MLYKFAKYSPLELPRTLLRWYISTFVTIYSIGEESVKVVIWRIFMELPHSEKQGMSKSKNGKTIIKDLQTNLRNVLLDVCKHSNIFKQWAFDLFISLCWLDFFSLDKAKVEILEGNGELKKRYQQEPLKHKAQIEDLRTSLKKSEEQRAHLQHQLLDCKTQLAYLQAKSEKEQHKYQEDAEEMRQRILYLELLLSERDYSNNEQLKDQTSSMDENQLDQGQTDVVILEPHMTSSGLKEETQECPNETQRGKNAQQTKIQKTLNKIQEIRQDIENITKEVEEFSGSQEHKTFLHLKEMLIQNVLKLDNVESEDNNIIRQERKEAIKHAHQVLRNLIDRSSK